VTLGFLISLAMVVHPKRIYLLQYMAVTLAMLANAAGVSWDLLVQVGRIRRADGEAPKA